MKKKIGILGSTGSIGKNTVSVINSNKKENTNKEKSVLSENLFEENIEKIYKDFFKGNLIASLGSFISNMTISIIIFFYKQQILFLI